MLNRIKGLFTGKESGGNDLAGEQDPQSSAPTKAEPVSLQHVWTAEPNAVKLRVSRMILPLGETRAYGAPEQAGDSPLAQALFAVEGVTSVSLDGVSVEVTLAEDADWDVLMEKVPETIKRHLDSGLTAVEGFAPAAAKPDPAAENGSGKKYNFGFRHIPEGTRSPEEQKAIVQKVLDEEINPAVAAHGGFFNLISVENNNVYVQLGGGCQGCGMVDVTLRQGVEQRIKEVLPEMHELIDVTDHQSGDNPYYQPGK